MAPVIQNQGRRSTLCHENHKVSVMSPVKSLSLLFSLKFTVFPLNSAQFRKILVERDRINRSIVHLRELFHETTQMPEQQFVRLDKADILEMTVGFLKQRANSSFARGFSQCLQETLRHVSLHANLTHNDRESIKRFYVLQRTNQMHLMASTKRGLVHISAKRSSSRVPLWRPWKNN